MELSDYGHTVPSLQYRNTVPLKIDKFYVAHEKKLSNVALMEVMSLFWAFHVLKKIFRRSSMVLFLMNVRDSLEVGCLVL